MVAWMGPLARLVDRTRLPRVSPGPMDTSILQEIQRNTVETAATAQRVENELARLRQELRTAALERRSRRWRPRNSSPRSDASLHPAQSA